jgi:hypothetical protein
MTQKSKRMKSDFEAWFEEQFGKRPISEARHCQLVETTIPGLEYKLSKARREVEDYGIWHRAKRAASFAWQARERLGK